MRGEMIGTRVLLRAVRDEALSEQSPGGLWLGHTEHQRFDQWEVLAAGPEVHDVTIAPGARVIASRFSGQPWEQDGETLRVTEEPYIIAIITTEA